MARGLEKTRKVEVVAANRIHEKDSGSADVQIAILTERIRHLTEHLKIASKDFATRRGLQKMVGRRASLLRYLARTDAPRYQALIARLGLKK